MQDQNTTTERSLSTEIKLYYDLRSVRPAPAPLLIALHGYGASKRQMMREAQAIAPEGFAIASLQGPHQHLKEPREVGGPLRFGFGWLTNYRPEESVGLHHRALLRLIDSLTDDGSADPGRIFLLGFSQSCALNYRFAFTHPDVLRGVIGICGGIPGDWETSELYRPTNASVFHLSGERDEFYPPARTADYAAQLLQRAPDVEFKSYDAGHEIVQSMRDDIRSWLAVRQRYKEATRLNVLV
jgi:phospholipase/carboxylesterase